MGKAKLTIDNKSLEIWTSKELKVFKQLTNPFKIQAYLDHIPYSEDPFYRSPRSVMRDGKAHCFDGAIFAACALRMIGQRPLVIDILADNDDDHLLAIYKVRGYLGAVAKSNFVGLRFREAIYRTLRELVLSYFEAYYNVDKEKTLRGYTVTLDLMRFDHLRWMTSDKSLEKIADALDQIRQIRILTPSMVKNLNPMDDRSYQAGMLGINKAGLYRPPKK
jgi:hypothetical protein